MEKPYGTLSYYSEKRWVGNQKMSIYEIWEKGCAYGDSVTPSTFNHQYRSHVVLKITSLTRASDLVLSFGCGNAAVEAELVRRERVVRGIDVNAEAVRFARAKGIDAVACDFFELDPVFGAGASVFYADGFLGHVFKEETGLDRFFGKFLTFAPMNGAHLLLSNDSPRAALEYEPHESVDNFWFLSHSYITAAAERAGLTVLENYNFSYERPISGVRSRAIVLARVTHS